MTRQLERNQDWRIVKIVESNPSSNHFEARDQYDTPILIEMVQKDTILQIPAEGELWTVTRRGSDWLLNARYDGDDVLHPISSLDAGDGRWRAPGTIYMDSSDVHVSGDLTVEGDVITAGAGIDITAAVVLAPTIDTRNRIAPDISTRLILASKLTADANNRWQIDGTGKQSWGDGTAAVDTNLYRTGANVLKTDDSFQVSNQLILGASASNPSDTGLCSDGANVYLSASAASVYLRPTGVNSNVGMLALNSIGTGTQLTFHSEGGSGDVGLFRSGANELSMATGDTFKVAAVGLKFSDNSVQITKGMSLAMVLALG